jgi:hypothetical protein
MSAIKTALATGLAIFLMGILPYLNQGAFPPITDIKTFAFVALTTACAMVIKQLLEKLPKIPTLFSKK